ncbi:ATP-dependent DNA ligase [Candidatus Woesearchaeota archaeon]|nr:ATP-dependent DNA ligase [Candidatus Woesearchaeota archaeon]
MPTLFKDLASFYDELEAVSSHLKLREILVRFFKRLSASEVKITAYLTLGTIGPHYEKTELGIAEKMAIRAVCSACDVSKEKATKLLKQQGDLGGVAESLGGRGKNQLTIQQVYHTFLAVRDASGGGSQDKKIQLLTGILKSASPAEAKYIIRIALGKLRLGVADKSLLDAFAIAFTGSIDNKEMIEDSYNVCTDIGGLGEALAKKGIKATRQFDIALGRPVQSMLAQRVNEVPEILEKIPGEIAAEEKYDGERMQIHKDGARLIAFSRRLENISAQYPEIIEAARKSIKAKTTVLDGEVVAVKNGKIMPFQLLMQRRRKYNIEEYRVKIPTVIFLFDILYLNGESLLKRSYPERKKLLASTIRDSERVKLAGGVTSARIDVIQAFFEKSVKRGLEGIIAKSTGPESLYKPGKRGWAWIKWKKEYAQGMRETFDLAVVGSYAGKGSRKGRFGALLCAAYNKQNAQFETFTKVGSGFTEKDFVQLKKALHPLEARTKPKLVRIEKTMLPDTYYEPGLVIEVLGAEITDSPNHAAAKDVLKTGLALRFPRFIRIRKDKGPTDATTVKEIIALHKKKYKKPAR